MSLRFGPRVLQQPNSSSAQLARSWSTRTTRKQRVTATRLHRKLLAEALTVGETTVRLGLAEKKHKHQEVFGPLQHHGEQLAEVDFFEVTVDIAGERRKVWMLVIRLMDSGRDFAWLYDRCDRISLLGCPTSSRILHPILIVARHAPESRQGRCTLN